MNQLIQDLWNEIQGYYEQFVTLLPKLLLASLLLFFFLLVARRVRKLARRLLTRRMDDPLLAGFLAGVAGWTVIILAFLIFLHVIGLGAAASGLLASAGVGAFIIGFAFKDIGENLLAGIMLAFKRPFKLGDLVETNSIKGKVVTMSLRDTQVKTAEGIDVFVPNATIIKSPLMNYTVDGDLRFEFVVGLDYGSDVDQAVEIVLETLAHIKGIMQAPRKPVVMVKDLGASTLNLVVYYWIDAFDKGISGAEVKNQAVSRVLTALTEKGYYLPGDILEFKNYRDVALQTRPAEGA